MSGSARPRKPRSDADPRVAVRAGVHRIYLPAPVDAQARAKMQTGPSPRLQSDPVATLYGYAMEVPAVTRDRSWGYGDPLHDNLQSVRQVVRQWLTRPGIHRQREASGKAKSPRSRILHGDGSHTVAKKGGDGIGYSGHKHQKGEKVIAIVENNGFVLAPLPVAPVNEADTVLLPDGLNALKRVARLTDLKIGGAYLNLDGGFDSRHNRKAIFNAGLVPNVKENRRIGRRRNADASGCSMPRFIRYGYVWSGPSRGRTSSSDGRCASSSNNSGTTG